MKGNPLSKRLIVLLATVALLMISAVPVSAAPGGVPGPPPGHDKAKDDAPEADDGESETKELPAHAKAYGKRIKDLFGFPYGHLQQCARLAADEPVEDEAVSEDDEEKKSLEACMTDPQFPDDERGAKAFFDFNEALFVVTDSGDLVVGI